jgi:hypothetical protein
MDIPPLQPLRIPAGWLVQYNNGLYEIDPNPELIPEADRWWIFKEDMLTLWHSLRNRLLDVGWYPEGNLEEGHYGLVMYEGDFTGELLHEFQTRDTTKWSPRASHRSSGRNRTLVMASFLYLIYLLAQI